MLIDLGVVCAWIAMSLAGAVGLGSLRRFGADSTPAVEAWADGQDISPDELYPLEPLVGVVG